MNAKRLIMTLVFAAILIAFVVWITSAFIRDAGRKNRLWNEQAKLVTDAAESLNNKKIDIMVMGEDFNGPKNLSVRHINDLRFITLEGDETVPAHKYHIVIINDPNGTVNLTENDYKTLLKRAREDSFVVVYLGSAAIPQFQKNGFFFDSYSETARSAIFYNGGRSYEIGFADNTSVLPEVVREQIDPNRFPAMVMVMKLAQDTRYLGE